MAYAIDFATVPRVGTRITYRGALAELVAVTPYVRKTDGAPSHLLLWRVGTRHGTSGLRSNSLMWTHDGDHDA